MKIHELKTWPTYYQPLIDGDKTFELRRDDRDFIPFDRLWLREWNPETQEYTGRECYRDVTYVLRHSTVGGLQDGFVIMGLAVSH